MAIFYRNDIDTSEKEEDTVLARITRKATALSEAIPAEIRNKLAGLRADLQGKTEDYKKARSETRENAGKLKTEIQEL